MSVQGTYINQLNSGVEEVLTEKKVCSLGRIPTSLFESARHAALLQCPTFSTVNLNLCDISDVLFGHIEKNHDLPAGFVRPIATGSKFGYDVGPQ